MNRNQHPRRLRSRPRHGAMVLAGALAGLAVVAFLFGRHEGGRGDALARAGRDPVVSPVASTQSATPIPGARPDTSFPLWGVPFLEADHARARFDQVINGIAVGPTVSVASSGRCTNQTARSVPLAGLDAGPLTLPTLPVPASAVIDSESAIACDGQVVLVERSYALRPAPDAERKTRTGEASWFDIDHGGAVSIYRGFKQFPAQDSDIAAHRWSATTVAGLPAAVRKPILDEGFGPAIVVVWDSARGIQTVVTGLDVPLSALITVAEEALR